MSEELPGLEAFDGTARPQMVNKDANPRYWRLIDEFKKITGIPMLLNTSFNVRGQPIVCTPKEAIDTFLHAPFEALAIGNAVVGSGT